MTIPIQTPQIGTTGVVTAPSALEQLASGYQVVALALQKRQELEQARQELAQRREQFELNKKLAGSQLAGAALDQEKKKRDLQAQEEDLRANTEALHLFTGSIPDLNTPEGIGRVLAGIKDPRVAAHFYTYLKDAQTAQLATTPNQEIRASPSPTSPSGYEYIGINPRNPTQTVSTGRPAPNPNAPTQRIPVVTEREKASAAVSSIRANAMINALEAADPTIGQRVARKAAVRKSVVSGLMRRLTGTSTEDANLLAESQIEQSMTPEELQYYVAGKQLLSGILPGLSGKQVTAREYVMHAPAYLSMGSSSASVIRSRANARATRIRSFIAEAGDAFPERLPELQDVDLSPYGLGTVVLPDSSAHQIMPGRARYHPRFNTRP